MVNNVFKAKYLTPRTVARRHKKPIKFTPKNPDKYVGDRTDIVSRSTWETRFMDWCDRNPSVIRWNSEGLVIPYFSRADNKNRRYFVDFLVELRLKDNSTKTVLIEIKPYDQTIPPKAKRQTRGFLEEMKTYYVNQDKWEAASKYAKRNGIEFKVMTEYDLGIKKRKA